MIKIVGCNDVTITNNSIKGNSGINVKNSADLKIKNNKLDTKEYEIKIDGKEMTQKELNK